MNTKVIFFTFFSLLIIGIFWMLLWMVHNVPELAKSLNMTVIDTVAVFGWIAVGGLYFNAVKRKP